MFDVIVIGGGPAGVTAALRVRELGAMVALVERNRMGGTCTNDGCVPTRVLAKAARLLRDTEQFDTYGLIGDRPVLDFARLMARTQQVVYQIQEKKQLVSHLETAGVSVYAEAGEARFIDGHTVALADGTDLQAEKFILCMGGHPRRLNFPGTEYTLTHHDVWSLKRLPRSVVIVGAAATGCQLASIFAAFGSQVCLLDVAPRILPTEDELVSLVMAESFAQRGIEILTGTQGVARIDKKGDLLALQYTREGESYTIQAEAVIQAVGWPGNVETMNLEAAGVNVERSYIQVDDSLRTSAPHIYAAGDITGRMMLVQSGGYEATIAAENAVLGAEQMYQHQVVPHGGFTDPEYGSVGLTEDEARAGHAYICASVAYADLDRAVIDGHPEGFFKLLVSKETHQILGAHVVGEQAVEVVQLVAAGMAADIRVEQLADLELAYPTFTSIVGYAGRKLMREMGEALPAEQWRNLGRRHAAEWERSYTYERAEA